MRAVDKLRKLLQTVARRSALPELHSPGERRIRDADVRSRVRRLATSWCNQGSQSRSDKRELPQFLAVFLERLRSPARCRARARAARVHWNRRRGSKAPRRAKGRSPRPPTRPHLARKAPSQPPTTPLRVPPGNSKFRREIVA